MKSIKQVVKSIGATHAKKCVSTPNKWNSCEPCKNCGKPANYGSSTPQPCCGLINPPLLWDNTSQPDFAISNTITVPALNCPTTVYFTPYTTSGDSQYSLYLDIDGNQTQVYEGGPTQIILNGGESITWFLENSNLQDSCIEIYLYNETCNISNSICFASFCVFHR